MRIIKEAYVGDTRFIVAPDYVAIEGPDAISGSSHRLQFSRSEAAEVVSWLQSELNRVLPEIIDLMPVEAPKSNQGWAIGPKAQPKSIVNQTEVLYEPGARTATQTVELKLGDPNLAYRNISGRVPGDGEAGTIDLGALSGKMKLG